MSTRRPNAAHQEAVARRLAMLSAELATVRGEPPTHTRVREAAHDAPPPDTPVVVVPVPGRHASRRTLPGLTPAHLAIIAAVVIAGLVATCWALVRGGPEQVAAPRVVAAADLVTPAPVQSPAPAQGAAPSSTNVQVTVHVAGRVRRPGIVVLPPGSRVVDALAEAGGARRGVELTGLNLARILIDGEQILVGLPSPAGVAGVPVAPGSPGALVNLNTADQVTLETLPGVGPVTAQAILAWRTEHGSFTAVEELLEVTGIGEATLADLTPHVTL